MHILRLVRMWTTRLVRIWTTRFFPLFLFFIVMRKNLFSFFNNEETSWKAKLNIFKGLRHAHDEKWRLEAWKQDQGRIHLSKPKKAGKNGRDWCPLVEHRWKIVKALVALCAVVVRQKWRIAMNRCFPNHYSVKTKIELSWKSYFKT